MKPTALILGSTGRMGRNAATAFEAAGWDVRRFNRQTDSLSDAAAGADVIVNCWNPAYTDWAAQLPGQTAKVIKAAKAAGATIVVPGNVYVYGADAPSVFGPDTPHRAQNPLGRVRIEMEAAYRASGVRTIIVRAGDYLDSEASGNWFDKVMVSKLQRGLFLSPGPLDCPHAYAFLPDVAGAMVALATMREQLDRFTDIAAPGFTLTGQQIADTIGRITGTPVRARRMAWWPIRLASVGWPLGRKLLEMRYLWNKPHSMPHDDILALCPQLSVTPLDQALAAAIDHQIDPDKAVRTRSQTVAAE